ncbi:MAG: Gfo/Idh/MocA family oxidoreductase [Verrucomicrobiota bacterium]|nr:Gfo/Idh/MocA family oxidoreductase [Verrucomicrobiota bacterium]
MADKDRQTKNIGIVVIGAGSIGVQHCHALQDIRGVIPVVVSRRLECAQDLTQPGVSVVKHLKDALSFNTSFAIIASETISHVEHSLEAMAAGLTLLVEKPLAIDSIEANKIHSVAKISKKLVFVGCVLRFSDSLNKFRAILHNLGKIYSVRIECQSYLPSWRTNRPYRECYSASLEEGGVLRDLIHEIDYACWIFGWPDSIYGKIANLGVLDIDSEEVAELLWTIQEGPFVSIRLDYITQLPRRKMTAYGEDGYLEWDGIANTVTLTKNNSVAEKFEFHQTKKEMLTTQAMALLYSGIGSEYSMLATGEEGVKALAVCDAARKASSTGVEEKISYQ